MEITDICIQSGNPLSRKEMLKHLYEAVQKVEKIGDDKYWFTLHIDRQREGE